MQSNLMKNINFAKKEEDDLFFEQNRLTKYREFITLINIQMKTQFQEDACNYLHLGQYQKGLQTMDLCLEEQTSVTYSNHGLHLICNGRLEDALADLNRAVSMDYLNYLGYFNLFSLHYRMENYVEAFKCMAGCLSIAYLIHARHQKEESHADKSIHFCFNNKEARVLKGLMRLSDKKYIEALNELNYAIYLDPANKTIRTILEKIYKKIGIKELKTELKLEHKPKYNKLQTMLEMPSGSSMQLQLGLMVQEFISIISIYAHEDVFRIRDVPFHVGMLNQAKANLQEAKQIIVSTTRISEDTSLLSSEQNEREWNIDENSNYSLQQIIQNIGDAPFFADLSFSESSPQDNKVYLSGLAKIANASGSDASVSDSSINNSNECYLSEVSNLKDRRLDIKVPREIIAELKENERVIVTFQKINSSRQRENAQQILQIIGGKDGRGYRIKRHSQAESNENKGTQILSSSDLDELNSSKNGV